MTCVAVALLLWALLQGHNAIVHGKDETNICQRAALADDDNTELKGVCVRQDNNNMFIIDDDDEEADKTKNDGDDGDDTPNEFFGAFRRLGTSWKNMVLILRNIVNAAGGTQKPGDVLADTTEDALELLTGMVAAAAAEGGGGDRWLFRTAPHKQFGLEITDVFKAFLTWAAVDGAEDGNDITKCRRMGGVNARHAKINVSKAFRRLERYSAWMEATGDDLVQPPLTPSSFTKAWEAFSMNLSHDDCDRLVWWLDLSRTDLDALRALPPKEILRLFVWFAHLMLFDKRGQENGIVFIQCFAGMSFWSWMTMLPLNLGIQVDEFVISVIPLKTRIVLFLDRPKWVRFGYKLLSVILTRAMKKRVFMVPDKNPQQSVEKVVNVECIPVGFDGLNGSLEQDPFDILSIRIPSSDTSGPSSDTSGLSSDTSGLSSDTSGASK